MLMVSYSDHFLSVVCPSVRPSVLLTFSNDFSSEAAELFLVKFHVELPRLGERKIAEIVAVR